MKIESNYNPATKIRPLGEQLKGGDVVYCDAGDSGALSFYGIYVPQVGVVELSAGSTAYMSSRDYMYVHTRISYWEVTKIFKDAKLVIKEVE